MITKNFSSGRIDFKDKLLSLDYPLIFLTLLLGIISFFAMYSTEGGVFVHSFYYLLYFLF